MFDTVMRQWQMLRLVPRHPAKISTAELKRRLADEGFEVHQRTIQRDLVRLSDLFPLVCDDRSRPFGWSWMADAQVMDIPGMDSHTALTFHLVERYLEPLLPASTLHHLKPHFRTAAHILDTIATDKGVPAWREKVRVLHRGPRLQSPAIDEEVQGRIDEALLYGKRLRITYSPRWEEGEKEYEISPLGLVLKEGVIYLVCTMWDYADIRQLSLHRIRAAEVLDVPACRPQGFDLDAYIASGEFGYPVGGMIRLEALFSEGAAYHLGERPLADDQSLEEQGDGRVLLAATVQDTSELRWWLLGFGDQVEVLAPKELREEFARIAATMAANYKRQSKP